MAAVRAMGTQEGGIMACAFLCLCVCVCVFVCQQEECVGVKPYGDLCPQPKQREVGGDRGQNVDEWEWMEELDLWGQKGTIVS